MTKALRWSGAAALAILVAAQAAAAHGAPPVREVDTRVLLDDDGLVAYGGCVEDQCQPAAPAGGLDLLALDMREAAFPDGSPAVVFRVIVQSEVPVPGASVAIALLVGGAETTLGLATEDGLSYTSTTFERVDGPFDVGDGHPKAIDGWIRHATLAAATGDRLTGLRVESRRSEAPDDAMPGGWFSNGVEVQRLPHDPGEAAAPPPAPGEYALKGPASLLGLTAEPGAPDLSKGPATVRLRLSNPVGLPQFANLALSLPDGVAARLSQPALSLDANGAREAELHVSNATAGGVVRVTVVSDLGAFESVDVPVQAPPPAMPASSSTAGAPSTGRSSPSPALAAPAALAFALLLSRSRVPP